MKHNMGTKVGFLTTLLLSLAAVAQAQGDSICSSARLAGAWGYTYTGALILSTGAVPAGSVGRFAVDAAGNLSGAQTSSVGGAVGEDTTAGTVAVNSDCTGTATVRIYSPSGTLLRTAALALVFVDNAREFRAIFQSVVLANGMNVPAVITMDGKKLNPGRSNEQLKRAIPSATRGLSPAECAGCTSGRPLECRFVWRKGRPALETSAATAVSSERIACDLNISATRQGNPA